MEYIKGGTTIIITKGEEALYADALKTAIGKFEIMIEGDRRRDDWSSVESLMKKRDRLQELLWALEG